MSDGEKHEPSIDTYAIGSADTLEIDYVGGTDTVQFDLQQIRENNYIRYYIDGFGHGVYFDTPEIPDGENPAKHWIKDIKSRTGYEVRALIVPDYLSEDFLEIDDIEIRFR